jgi:DNA helicase-2/ATP-dependent DNA helicase PcrA
VESGEEHLAMIYDKYEKDLIRSNMIDFDDLLLLPYQIMKKSEEVLERRQNKFDYILVDEAQDTNRIQFELMRLLSVISMITFI